MSPSKEVARPDSVNASLVLDVISGAIPADKLVFTKGDPDEIAKRIEEKDLNATSLADLLGSNVTSGKDFANRPFELRSVEWQESTRVNAEGGLPFYAVLHGVDTAGRSVIVACGGKTIVRKVAKMAVEGWLPAWVKIVVGKTNEQTGNTPLDLEDASEFAPFQS